MNGLPQSGLRLCNNIIYDSLKLNNQLMLLFLFKLNINKLQFYQFFVRIQNNLIQFKKRVPEFFSEIENTVIFNNKAFINQKLFHS